MKLRLSSIILTFVILSSCGEPVDPCGSTEVDPNFVADLNANFDAAYLPENSLDYFDNSQTVTDNSSVGVIKDMIGNRDLNYAGLAEPKLTGRPPIYHNDAEGKYIYFDNETETQYNSEQFAGESQPYEVWMVWRQWQGPRGEAFNSHPRGFEWRDREKALGMSAGLKADVFAEGTLMQPTYTRFIVRAQFNDCISKCWINNVQVQGTLDLGQALLENINVGTNSNNAHADFFGMWVKFGLNSDEAATFIYNELASRYSTTDMPTLPWARDITLDFSGDTWTANYTYENSSGTPEDANATEYRWYYGHRGSAADLPNQVLIDGATSKTFNRTDYPDLFSSASPQGWIKCQVKVYDTNGDSWRFNSSNMVVDNIY